ncbi:MAG: DUF4623 domain-containing protein, partial [Limisphaerales bacterium]
SYYVVVSNDLGAVTSSVATLTVQQAAPVFTRQPINVTVTAGNSTNLTGQALGIPSYQWFRNGAAISGATSTTFPITSATDTHIGSYYLVASNLFGASTSRTVSVTVNATAPQITTQPTNRTALTGGRASFVSGASGAPAPTYQWQKNGVNIPHATTATLSFSFVIPDDAGNYRLIASNYAGIATSQVAVLEVLPLQTVSGSWYSPSSLNWVSGGDTAWQTQTTTTYDGGDAAASGNITTGGHTYLETEVTGPGTLSFWWKVSSFSSFDRLEFYTNGVLRLNISGERDWQQVIVQIAEGTQRLRWRYSMTSFSGLGQNKGWIDQVVFSGLSQPVFTTHPRATAVLDKGYTTLAGEATGVEPITYQWLFNGALIPGATDRTLLLTNFSQAQAGNYTLRAGNEHGFTLSSNALLTVRPFVQTDAMQVLWRKVAGSATWLPIETGHSYRGISFNPLTTNVLVVSRIPSLGVHLLDGDTGEELGKLQTTGISGGSFVLNMVGVADDGAVYAANLTTSSRTSPLKIYRWENDSTNTTPVLVWSGDPGSGEGAIRWGDSMDVRGAGANTEIILGSGTGSLNPDQIAIIRPADGINSPARLFQIGSLSQLINVGFGADNRIWYRLGQNLYSASAAGQSLSDLKNYTNAMSQTAAFAINPAREQIARLIMDSPDYVQLSQLDLPALNPIDSHFILHPMDQTNSFLVGAVSFKGNRIYAINSNNGIIALKIRPQLQLTRNGAALALHWHDDEILQSASNPEGPFEDVATATSPYVVEAADQKRFFRLRSR